MTIGKKLYSGFGAIVAIMIALFFVSVLTISREHSARSVASATLNDMTTIESIRFQVMLEELVLRNFLLSGDVDSQCLELREKGPLLRCAKGQLPAGEQVGHDARTRALEK